MRTSREGVLHARELSLLLRRGKLLVLAFVSCAQSFASLTGAALANERPAATTGFVVEEVTKGYLGARQGIQAGDELLTWEAKPADSRPSFPPLAGTFRDPFDAIEAEEELGAWMPVRLTLERGDQKVTVDLPVGPWRLSVRPPMSPSVSKTWQEAVQKLRSKKFAEAVSGFEEAARIASGEGSVPLSVWILMRGGAGLADAFRPSEARGLLEKAAEAAAPLERPLVLSRIHQVAARNAMTERRYPTAEKAAESMKKAEEAGGENRLTRLVALQAWAYARFYLGDVPGAEKTYLEVLEVIEKKAPESFALASILADLDILYQRKPDYAKGTAMAERALALIEPSYKGIPEIARLRGHLGILATLRGDSDIAEKEFRSAVAAHEAIDPESLGTAMALANLSRLVGERGDLDTEEALLRRSLAIREKLGVPPQVLATIWTNLGGVAVNREDFTTARERYSRVLAIYEKNSPESLDVVGTLYNLALCDMSLGNRDEAVGRLTRALEIGIKVGPDSRETTGVLSKLGSIKLELGDVAAARSYFEKALAADTKVAPGSRMTALSLRNLSQVERKTGNLARAESLLRESLAITARIQPGSTNHAVALHRLGGVLRDAGRTGEALEAYRSAVEALEAQRGRLGGGSETDARYLASMMEIYTDYLDLLLSLGKGEDAFLLLERSRARSLLAMLAERDLVFTADIPEEIERQRRRLEAEYDKAQSELQRLSPGKDDEAIEKTISRLGDLRARQDALVKEIRKESPRLAALRYPQPLGVTEVQRALDPGTALVSYGFIPSGLAVFVLRGGPEPRFLWKVLPVPREGAEKKVRAFRNLLTRPVTGAAGVPDPLWRAAADLNDALLGPVEPELRDASRILVVADGPLRLLPFAALARQKPDGSGLEFLAAWKPFHKAVSATVYAELKKARREGKARTARLAAFGDPVYSAPAEEQAPVRLRSGMRDALSLAPLPSTRKEVEAVAALFGKSAKAYLGKEATEEAAKALPKGTDYVHFACHGVLDQTFPLNSGLALSSPKPDRAGTSENGILQAWEIFQRVRLDADLVVLSACETGLGMEGGGEGLIGLTRAFQYAGARTVLASLWGVSDESTLELMKVFYRELRNGRPKDEALQAAQKALSGRHPFFWAAFELEGDWK